MADQTMYRHTLVLDFFGDLLKRTMDAPTAEAHQQALQAFLEDLSPWVLPDDLPTLLAPPPRSRPHAVQFVTGTPCSG